MAEDRGTVIVAGAGLGGLCLALCLVRAGIKVTVLEQAERLGEVGAGVQISANGARVLYHLGLADALQAVAFNPERGEIRHWQSGETLSSRPLGRASEERFGFPYFHLHRADFHQVLADTLASARPLPQGSADGCRHSPRSLENSDVHRRIALGRPSRRVASVPAALLAGLQPDPLAAAPTAVHLANKVTGFEQSDAGVRVTTATGESFTGDVLVGCDGIHSAVRAQLFGPDEPRFTGCIAWRATVPVAALPPGHVRPVSSNWIGRGGHFVHYYVRRGELVNCVGVIERDQWQAESWSSRGDKADFLADFQDWHEDVQILIREAESCFRSGLFDREPMAEWSDGRVTLLGDACHPMLPFMAQGAVMAIEDAYTLAQCLSADPGNPASALGRYEALRRDRTAMVQRMSRDNIQFFHHADLPDLAERMSGHREAHMWLYSFDVTAQDFAPTS